MEQEVLFLHLCTFLYGLSWHLEQHLLYHLAFLFLLLILVQMHNYLHCSLLTPNSEVAVPLRNLMSVISLGDKFRFRHDLFSDDNDLFKETIEILNTLEDFTKAVDFLDEKFNWDPEDATVVYFYDIIKPKF